MIAIISRYVQTRRMTMLGWGCALFSLAFLVLAVYDSIEAQFATYQELTANFPQELMAFFGDFSRITSPVGYLDLEFFSYMPLILGIFGLLAGSGLLAGDEENGRLELVQSAPVSRLAVYWGRYLGLGVVLGVILLAGWLGMVIPLGWVEFDLGLAEALLPFGVLGVSTLWFASMGLLLSQWLPSRRLAASLTALVLIASFFLNGFAKINQDLLLAAKALPLYYYQGGDAINELNLLWLGGLLTSALAMAWAGWWLYERRDLRVSGEGSIRWFKRRQHG